MMFPSLLLHIRGLSTRRDAILAGDKIFVESQLLSVGSPTWNFCAPVMDYDIARVQAASAFVTKTAAIRAMVAKLQKTQRAAEKALDSYVSKCGSRQ